MRIWHLLEDEDEVNACLKDKEYKMIGAITHPETLQPLAVIRVEKFGEGNSVVFLVPMGIWN